MKKVLIVSPHFPPINAPDMQRVRLALPHLRAAGWEPTVLAVAPDYIEGGVRDPLLEATYPADVRVVRVRGILPGRTRWAGVGNLWWRCGRALADAGAQLLGAEKFDLVFFSTTQFPAFTLGPKWRSRFGVPFVVDYQDPWVTDYYERTGTRPPGGWLKFALSQWTAKREEPRVLRASSGAVSVSDSYPEMLSRLYPWYDPRRVRLLPFGASGIDFDVAASHRPAAPLVDFNDGNLHHIYTGRSGPDMVESLTMLFRGFARFRAAQPELARRMRFHFIGTGYAPPPMGEDTVLPVAKAEGVAEHVREHRYRVPYFDTLYYMRHAHALLAVGSNDATYSASKIFSCVLARRPLLLIFHAQSLVLKFAHEVNAGLALSFTSAADIDRVAATVERDWFAARNYEKVSAWHEAAFRPYSAASMTARLVEVFEDAVRA
ncbi:MAG: hypothetical protein V4773_26370 [Verrucomicrobiota bacterium]